MASSKILTISIAAYNVEKFIEQTLNSLIKEADILEKLEIFVVDDGGTDHTLDIADAYSNKYEGTVYCCRKTNGGYGSVINYSIERATGKYFKQLDGDDWFDSKFIREYVDLLEKTEADCVITPMYYYDNEHNRVQRLEDDYAGFQEGLYTFNDINPSLGMRMHLCTFKTSVLKKMNYRITEKCFYTDMEYCHAPVRYMNNIYISHIPLYVYRIGSEEQSININNMKKRYKAHETVLFKLQDLYDMIPEDEVGKRRILYNRIRSVFATQLRLQCMQGIGIRNFFETKSFLDRYRVKNMEVFKKVVKEGKIAKWLIYSHGLMFPFIVTGLKLKYSK